MVSEMEELDTAPDEDEQEFSPADEEGQLAEILKTEAEALAAELDEAADQGVDPGTLQEVEGTVESAAEALVTMKEARSRLAEVRKDRGYGKSSNLDNKTKNNQKKLRSNCFDCGQPGHWAGDAECKKPGMKLGRKTKQVQITEAMTTEHLIPEEGEVENSNEVLAVTVQPLAETVVAALEASHNQPKEVNLASIGLTADKRLVGALDSACNRTCTGPEWLQGYLKSLQTAPESIKNLVISKPEQETFRFGNGGTKVSLERWRLPTVIGGQVVCFWTSLVPVPSLGLLLGRDFLEAVGADISFMRRELRCERLDGLPIALKQLSAGHYLLPLAPASWPKVGIHRWRRLGPDGVAELQMSVKAWFDERLKSKKLSHVEKHDHMLTESSLKVGNLVCTVMSSPSTPSMVQAPTMRSALAERQTPTTSSPTRKTTCSTRSLKSPARDDESRARTPGDKMAQISSATSRSRHVGRKGRPPVAFAKALLALAALAIPGHVIRGEVAVPSAKYGPRKGAASEAFADGPATEAVHNDKPGRMCASSPKTWTSDVFLRGCDAERNAGSSAHEGHGGQVEEGCTTRGFGRVAKDEKRPSERGGGKVHDRTKGRTSHLAGRSVAPRQLAACEGRRKGQDRRPQSQSQADCQRVEGEASSFDSCKDIRQEGCQAEERRQRCRSVLNVCGGQAFDKPDREARRTPSKGERNVGGDHRPSQPDSREHAKSGGGFDHGGREVRRGRSLWTHSRGTGRDQRCPDGTPLCGKIDGKIWHRRPPSAGVGGDPSGQRLDDGFNPYLLNQEIKTGQSQMIAQAWAKHEADRLKTSWGPRKIRQVLVNEFEDEMKSFVTDEIFVQPLNLAHSSFALNKSSAVSKPDLVSEVNATLNTKNPFVTEVYTTSQNVTKEAARRGHNVGEAMSLDTGWNFLIPAHREAALKKIAKEKPYCVMLAFPCGPFSPLQRLNQRCPERAAIRRKEGRVLMDFALEVAKLQMSAGRHCILENPKPSEAWKEPSMQQFLEEYNVFVASFDQCRFGLRSIDGLLHRKPTTIASSGSKVVQELEDRVCTRDHVHAPVLGGSRVTARAGIYPKPLACALVRGLESQFDSEFAVREVYVGEAGDGAEEDLAFEGAGYAQLPGEDEGSDVDDPAEKDGNPLQISSGVRAAVQRLHENTGHRSGKRLARALAIAGAPAEAVAAARQLKCALCHERKPPKSRRPASLPLPKDMGDQVHIDLIEVDDYQERRFYIAHATDYATRFQAAEVLSDKSTRFVIKFINNKWLATFGPPRVLVCDQGREFTSWEMEEWASAHSVLLHHVAVQAPWQNGVAERSGGILKTLLSTVIASQGVCGEEDMQMALSESVAAYNGDINELGASPFQAAIGKQPRLVGDALGGIHSRLAEHGLLESKPSMTRQLAMREVAKIAITRLHFSRGLRKAELARSRNSTLEEAPTPGSICYFYRPLRYNNKTAPSKKKLTLKRWHGPALLIALEGNTNGFLSYKGQLTKCALEHVRLASTMEQIAAGSWREAIDEVVAAAQHDLTLRAAALSEGTAPPDDGLRDGFRGDAVPEQLDFAPQTPGFLPSAAPGTPLPSSAPGISGSDLPPLQPRELAGALQAAAVPVPGSGLTSLASSRRASTVGDDAETAGGSRKRASSLPSEGRALMGSAIQKAHRFEESQRFKRTAEVPVEELQRRDPPPAPTADEAETPVPLTSNQQLFDANMVTKEDVLASLGDPNVHPLVHLYHQACVDRQQPLENKVLDHGSWDGRWPLPSRSEWQLHQRLGLPWPSGQDDLVVDEGHEVSAVQAARKEYFWKSMDGKSQEAFREAAMQAWQIWPENNAIEELSQDECRAVRARLKRNKEEHKILTPRYVFTDKNDPLRTPQCPLPLRARARIVVPGFKDLLSYTLRKDAPTGARISQHFLLTLTASFNVKKMGKKRAWRLMAADIKSAFMKGEFFEDSRELYMENVRNPAEPRLPFHDLVKIKKGVFGLNDAPRMWYIRLNKALLKQGWERSSMDFACWLLWSEDRTYLEGVIISHVDDLLLGGTIVAQEKMLEIGKEFGFGSVSYDSFTYCGKKIEQLEDGTIKITMKEYHENLKPVTIPLHRRSQPDASLTDPERRQLRAVLGSLQWLVAQLRFDMGFLLSTLQGETPTIKTLMKANVLLKQFKQNSDFALSFRPMDLDGAGIMVVTDSSLGNVTKKGGAEGSIMEKVYSQSAYYVLLADRNLLSGKEGHFTVIDARSHRLPRVCRSTYASELQGAEEAFDVGIFCRGIFAGFLGYPMDQRRALDAICAIPLAVVTDAKDVFDKGTSDTPTYGSQKSLAFTVAWVRSVLGQPNTMLKWTATENMFVDCNTKDMDRDHVIKILDSGKWCVVYNQDYVKQKTNKRAGGVVAAASASAGAVSLSGEPLGEKSPIFAFLTQLSLSPGWHHREGVVINVAKGAKSYRTPAARFDPKNFPYRTTYGRFDGPNGEPWKKVCCTKASLMHRRFCPASPRCWCQCSEVHLPQKNIIH